MEWQPDSPYCRVCALAESVVRVYIKKAAGLAVLGRFRRFSSFRSHSPATPHARLTHPASS